jgi:hypothetical protein
MPSSAASAAIAALSRSKVKSVSVSRNRRLSLSIWLFSVAGSPVLPARMDVSGALCKFGPHRVPHGVSALTP